MFTKCYDGQEGKLFEVWIKTGLETCTYYVAYKGELLRLD